MMKGEVLGPSVMKRWVCTSSAEFPIRRLTSEAEAESGPSEARDHSNASLYDLRSSFGYRFDPMQTSWLLEIKIKPIWDRHTVVDLLLYRSKTLTIFV